MLKAPCDAAIKVLFVQGQTSTQTAAAESGSPSVGSAEHETDDNICLEVTACKVTLHARSVVEVQRHMQRIKERSATMAE